MDIVKRFVNAGLLIPDTVVDNGKERWLRVNITNAGRRHFAFVRNLWYGICVKTGMYVERHMIKRGEEAKQLASRYIDSKVILDFYGTHGWVSEDDFINFIQRQETIEDQRVCEYLEQHREHAVEIANLMIGKLNSAPMLYDDYQQQLLRWERKGERIKNVH
jgi:hypothetical protein